MKTDPEELLRAYEDGDSAKFCTICDQLQKSKHLKKTTAAYLLEMIQSGNARQGELALNTLRITGISKDTEWSDQLLNIVDTKFSQAYLSQLAKDYAMQLRTAKRKLSPELRLLRSSMRAVAESESSAAVFLLARVEAQLINSPIARLVVKWKHPDN